MKSPFMSLVGLFHYVIISLSEIETGVFEKNLLISGYDYCFELHRCYANMIF